MPLMTGSVKSIITSTEPPYGTFTVSSHTGLAIGLSFSYKVKTTLLMSNQCSKTFIGFRKQRQPCSLASQGARRNVIAAGQVLQCVELRLCFAYAPLKDLNAGFESDADVAFLEIYAARRSLEALCIFDRLTVALKFSLVALELCSQICRLLGVPFRILRTPVRRR